MIDILKEHVALTILMSIIIGAIGSGLWDIALKPILKKLSEILLFVLTLGVKRARDGIYYEAAKGNKEQAGLYTAVMLSSFLAIIVTSSCTILANLPDRLQEAKAAKLACETLTTSEQVLSCKNDLLIQKIENRSNALILTISVSIALAILLLYRLLSIIESYRIITDYNQYITICRPWMSDQTFYRIHKDFALMKTKEDFINILEELNLMANHNQTALPRLPPLGD